MRLHFGGSPTGIRLDHVVIGVSSWERSNSFYRDVLDAEIVELPFGRYAYRFGQQQLNMHGPGSAPSPRARLPVPPGGSDLCLVWPGPIAAATAHLERHGVTVEVGPVPRTGVRGAGTSVYFRDPDGSLLEVISYAESCETSTESLSSGEGEDRSVC